MCYLNGSGIKINLKNHSTVLRIKFGEILKHSGKIIKNILCLNLNLRCSHIL